MALDTAPPANEGSALDPAIFAGLLELVDEDDDSFVVDLYRSWVRSYRDCIDGMRAARASADPDTFRRHAHTLKGASANVGATHLAGLAEVLQREGETGSITGSEAWLDAIADEYARVIDEVATRVPGFQPA